MCVCSHSFVLGGWGGGLRHGVTTWHGLGDGQVWVPTGREMRQKAAVAPLVHRSFTRTNWCRRVEGCRHVVHRGASQQADPSDPLTKRDACQVLGAAVPCARAYPASSAIGRTLVQRLYPSPGSLSWGNAQDGTALFLI